MAALNPNTKNNSPLVCILCAGQGTRLGPYLSKLQNKALLPLGETAVLSQIIAKFPPLSRFVIAVGYLEQQVRDYLRASHPDLQVEIISVENFSGIGSGPGHSLLACERVLREPFYFVPCDTLWSEALPQPADKSWLAVDRVSPSEQASYCNVVLGKDSQVRRLVDKALEPETDLAFTGLAYIADPQTLFAGIRAAETQSPHQESQMIAGLKALVPQYIESVRISWEDLGTEEKYFAALSRRQQVDFSKRDEAIYFNSGRVTKFFKDSSIITKRAEKAALKPELFPAIDFVGEQFYAYPLVEGNTLYKELARLPEFLSWAREKLWPLPAKTPASDLRALCQKFYRDKTSARLKEFEQRFGSLKQGERINDQKTPSLESLLARVPWEELLSGTPAFMHGDLQPDNILCTSTGFVLLDWRQDFAGSLAEGDLYYDLAKLRGGLELNYYLLKTQKVLFREDVDSVEFSLPSYKEREKCLEQFDRFATDNGFKLSKIKLLSGIIYANMAALHTPPLHRILLALARSQLYREIG